jgi:hypothetical protein
MEEFFESKSCAVLNQVKYRLFLDVKYLKHRGPVKQVVNFYFAKQNRAYTASHMYITW